jgi:hypothetical protein
MAHGHDDHGHDAHGGHGHADHDHPAGSLGILDQLGEPAEIPPEPSVRSISPAPSEYAQPFPGPGVAWPVVWLLIALVFLWSTKRWHGEVETPHEGHAAHGAVEPE